MNVIQLAIAVCFLALWPAAQLRRVQAG